MIAFHGKQETKDFYLNRVLNHRKMDAIIQGTGWDNGRGCAVGCTLENYDHKQYEIELGIPEWLARVEDTIFEGLPKEKALDWPAKFLDAVNPGASLEKIKTPFLIFILEENLKTLDALPDMSKFKDVNTAIIMSREATKEVIRCHREGLHSFAARSAAWSAESAESAAWSAAWSAESAAESAESAARSAESAESAAYEKYADKLADKLIELIEVCE